MELFQHFNTNFSIFWQNLQFFSNFLTYFYLFRFSQSQGPENILRGLIIIYWQFFIGDEIVFQLFNVTNFSNFLIKLAFFTFFKNFLGFFSLKSHGTSYEVLKLVYCIMSTLNGMSCKILTSRILAYFWQFLPF